MLNSWAGFFTTPRWNIIMNYVELYTTLPSSIIDLIDEQEITLTNGRGWITGINDQEKIYKFFHYWVVRDANLRAHIRGYDDGHRKSRQITDATELRMQIYERIYGPQPRSCPHGVPKKFDAKTSKFVIAGRCNACNSELVAKAKASLTDEEKAQIHQKRTQTLMERYGVDNAMRVDEFKEKVFESDAFVPGTDAYEHAQTKRKATNSERYGVC